MENKLELFGITLWLIASPILIILNASNDQLLSVTSAIYITTFLIAAWILILKIIKKHRH